jgi:primosomal protein N''
MFAQDVVDLLTVIRARRRERPTKKIREASAPAKTKRAPSKKAPKQQDLFRLAAGMTSEQKLKLAQSLIGGVL